jgi:hypothetical protein
VRTAHVVAVAWLAATSCAGTQAREFVPGTLHGTPTAVVVTVEMTFTLRN